jgi:hypothetical protein
MLSALSSEVRLLRRYARSTSTSGSKRSTILIPGNSGASPKRSAAPLTKLPGTGLPTSSSCITIPDQATSSPSQKIGIARIPSLACSAPHHGSLVKNMSPSRISSAGHSSRILRTNSSIVAPCCRM